MIPRPWPKPDWFVSGHRLQPCRLENCPHLVILSEPEGAARLKASRKIPTIYHPLRRFREFYPIPFLPLLSCRPVATEALAGSRTAPPLREKKKTPGAAPGVEAEVSPREFGCPRKRPTSFTIQRRGLCFCVRRTRILLTGFPHPRIVCCKPLYGSWYILVIRRSELLWYAPPCSR